MGESSMSADLLEASSRGSVSTASGNCKGMRKFIGYFGAYFGKLLYEL